MLRKQEMLLDSSPEWQPVPVVGSGLRGPTRMVKVLVDLDPGSTVPAPSNLGCVTCAEVENRRLTCSPVAAFLLHVNWRHVLVEEQ
jgi:hypothetical protein